MTISLLCWHDRATWTPLLDLSQDTWQTPEAALSALLRLYSGIRVFHGSRADSVASYLRDGLRPTTIADLDALARRIAHETDALVLDAQIDRAIEDVPFSVEGNVYASVDRRQLRSGSHFLRYGSERVYLILKRLAELNGRDYVTRLGAIGEPLILELAIPWVDVDPWLQERLASGVAERLDHVRGGSEPDGVDWVHAQNTPVAPDAVLSHYVVAA